MRQPFVSLLLAGFFALNLFEFPLLPANSRPSVDMCGCHEKIGETGRIPLLKAAVCSQAQERDASTRSSEDFLTLPVSKTQGGKISFFLKMISALSPDFLQDLRLDQPPRPPLFFSFV
jgi:hypothetical protein